jgi:hypothetical protein
VCLFHKWSWSEVFSTLFKITVYFFSSLCSLLQAFFAGGGHPGMGGHNFSFGGGHPGGGNQSFSFQFG